MPILLVRHADAVEERRDLGDNDRYLSPVGRRQARALGERLRWHDCTPAEVWSSPLCRALQTAELVTAVFGDDIDVRVVPALAPGCDVRALLAAVREAPATIMLVGHEPGLSGLLGAIIGDPRTAALAKAEAVRIDLPDPRADASGRRASDRPVVRWRFAHDDEAPRGG